MVRRALVIASLLALPGSVADAADAKRVAILYFDNDTKDAELDLLRKGMADMLITDLSDLDGVTIVEREKLEALLAEQKLQRSKYFDPKTAVKLGRGAGATHAVTGAFNAVGSKLRVDVRLVEVATGNVVATEKVVGQKKAFFTLQQRLAVAFACRLAEQRCGTKPSGKGPSLGTVRKYAKGLDLADSGKLKEATKTLQGVVTSAPNFKPAAETYRRIMKQLYAARSSRTDQLGDVRQKLQAKVDAVARADRLGQAKGIDEATVGRWVGYRVLGTQLVLQQIDAHFRVLAQAGASADSGQEKFAKLVERYRTQVDRLATDVEKYAAKHPGSGLPDCTLDDEDTALGKKLGLGDEPGVV
ncbi:MAG: CsgG/HfaB family protein, partial [Deltaproteobacteria bacterium]